METSAARLVRNVVANAGGRLVGIAIGLFATPYVIYRLGSAEFGIYVLVSALLGYFGLLDLGVGSGFARFVAAYHARGDRDALNELLSTGLMFYLAFGAVAASIGLAASDWAVAALNVESTFTADALFAVQVGIIGFALGNVVSVFADVPIGLQRMELRNVVGIAMSLLQLGGTIFVLEHGFGLRGLIVNGLVVSALSGVVWLAIDWHLLPGLALRWRYVRWSALRLLLSFGLKLQVAKLADLISFQFDKLLLSRFVGLPAVTNYQVGSRVVDLGRNLSHFIIPVLVPSAAELDTRGDAERLEALYRRAYKYLVVVAMPLMVFTGLQARGVITLWVGHGFDDAAIAVQVLALGYFFNLLAGPAAAIGAGVGRPDLQMRAWLWMAVANGSLSIVLVLTHGYRGVLVATTLSLAMGYFINLALFHRYLRVRVIPFLRATLGWPAVGCAVGAALSVATSRLVGFRWEIASRPQAAMALLLLGTVFIAPYALVVLRSPFLDEADYRLLRGLVPRLGLAKAV